MVIVSMSRRDQRYGAFRGSVSWNLQGVGLSMTGTASSLPAHKLLCTARQAECWCCAMSCCSCRYLADIPANTMLPGCVQPNNTITYYSRLLLCHAFATMPCQCHATSPCKLSPVTRCAVVLLCCRHADGHTGSVGGRIWVHGWLHAATGPPAGEVSQANRGGDAEAA